MATPIQSLLSANEAALQPGTTIASDADPILEALYDVVESPSIFARVSTIAGFRNSATGRYDSAQAARFYTPAVDDALRHLHLEIFIRWLNLSLQRQKADISIYLNLGAAKDRPTRIKQIVAIGERSIPTEAKGPERQLFLQALNLVQMLVQNGD